MLSPRLAIFVHNELGDLQDLLRGSSRSSIIGLDHAGHPVVESIQLSAIDLSTNRWLFVSLGS